jgi:hypothetical protein
VGTTAPRRSRTATTWSSSGRGLAGQTLDITARQEDGEATGELRITNVVVTLQCADTDTDGLIILGGEVTEDPDDNVNVGDLLVAIIREGEPDRVHLVANEDNARSCAELLESIPDDELTDDSNFAVVEDGYDIETS